MRDDDSPVMVKKPREEVRPVEVPISKPQPPKKKGLFDDDDE